MINKASEISKWSTVPSPDIDGSLNFTVHNWQAGMIPTPKNNYAHWTRIETRFHAPESGQTRFKIQKPREGNPEFTKVRTNKGSSKQTPTSI